MAAGLAGLLLGELLSFGRWIAIGCITAASNRTVGTRPSADRD
ncbi:hypothetical protein [Streptomyces sp. NPDC051636]